MKLFILDCTEIIEIFNFFQFLTSWGLEITRNPYYSGTNLIIFWNILNQQMLISHWIITYICKHHNAIFISIYIIFKLSDLFKSLIETILDCCPSWLKLLVYGLFYLVFVKLWNKVALDYSSSLLMENY